MSCSWRAVAERDHSVFFLVNSLMARIGSRKLWVLVLCAGGALAAATVGVLVRNQPAPVATTSTVTAPAAVAKGKECEAPDKIVIEGLGGPSGGWSYFVMQAVSAKSGGSEVSGSVHYYCEGEAMEGLTSQFDISVVCDGQPLDVQFDPNVGDLWSATITPPIEESVCHVHATATLGPGIPGTLDETYVFQLAPAVRPMVNITSPSENSVVYPDTISLTAHAFVGTLFGPDPPHSFSITKVEFFDESEVVPSLKSKLGEVTAPPYALPPISLQPAIHTIYAVATDSRGYQARSEPLRLNSVFNRPPEIRLHTPTFGARFPAPATVNITADFSDLDGPDGPVRGLQRVSFFDNTTLIHEVVWRTGPTTHSESYDWVNPNVGVRQIYVEAEDQRGLVRRIGPVNIFVTGDASPMAKVTAPSDGLFQATNVAIPLSASAVDDRTISNLDFVIRPWPGITNAGEVVVLGTAPSASALFRGTWTATASWTPTIAGRYVIRARAKDGAAGTTTLSDPIEIYADDNSATNFAPKVRIERPVNGDGVRQNTSMPITVKVQDGTGEAGIDKVYLYLDGSATSTWNAVAVSNGASPPIWTATGTFPIGALSAGPHTLMARAGDNGAGGSIRGDSPVITFNVLATGVNAAPLATIDFVTTPGSLNAGASVAFIVKARDANVDGSISKIEILANGDLISSPTTPLTLTPVPGRPNEATATMNWTANASGDFDVVARVTDNALLTGDSPPLKIRVNGIASNTAPVVALTEPASGSTFEVMPGGIVALRAVVSDPAASAGNTPGIALVEFYDGIKRLGSVSTGLPSGTAQGTVMYYWSNPPEGAHAVHARARDSQGTVTLSTPINLFMLGGPPSVSIVAPVAGATGFVAPESIEARVNVQDDYGVRNVYYYLDGVFAGSVGVEPFAFAYTGIGAGTHTLTAQAWDFGNHPSAMSAPVIINVAVNQLPTVSITSPTSGGNFAEGSSIALEVSLNDPDDHEIKKVEYLVNGSVVSTSLQAPFRGIWSNAAAGLAQNLTARATDKRGGVGSTTSATIVNIVAARPPVLSFPDPVLPGSDNIAFVGEQVSLSASASDPDASLGGLITRVDFFRHYTGAGGQAMQELISSDAAAPYATHWIATTAAVAQGNSTFSVKAYDNGPAGNGPTPRNMSSANSTVSVRVLAQNRTPSNVRFHPYIPTDKWLPAWGPAIRLPATPSNYQFNVLYDHIPTYRVQSNGRVTLCAYADDADDNVGGMRFYLVRPGVQTDVLLKTVSTRSAPGSFCSLLVRDPVNPSEPALDTIINGYSTEVDLSALHAFSGVQYLRAEAFDSRGLTATTAINPDPGQAGHVPCYGERFSPFNRSQLGSTCVTYSVPVAISAPNATTSPCGNGADGASPNCSTSRFALPAMMDNPATPQDEGVTVLQAERYDTGGQGLGMFEKNPAAGPSLRPDHDQAKIWCPTGTFNAFCTLQGFDNGEFRRYSITMPPGNSTTTPPGGNIVYTVRFKPSADVHLSEPRNGLYLDQETYINSAGNPALRFKQVRMTADMRGRRIGGATHSKIEVRYYTRPLGLSNPNDPQQWQLRGTSGPSTDEVHDFDWRPGGSTPVACRIGAE
jgi:hypothetical protein